MDSRTQKFAYTAVVLTAVIGLAYYLYSSIGEKEDEKKEGKNEKFEVVFVLGGPGSGKGTNCARIVDKYGYVHLSAGDLLRAEKQKKTDTAEMINQYILEGKIVPAAVTVGLLLQAMREARQTQGKNKFLVDGFPRDAGNLSCWEEKVSDYADVKFLLFLDCPEAVMEARLLERGKTSGRSDDNAASIKKRFKTYLESTYPIIEHFEKLGKTKKVNSHRSLEEVFADVSKCFEE